MKPIVSESEKARAVLLVAIGSIMFGFLGVFTRFLQNDKGIPAFDVAEIRLLIATLTMFVFMTIFCRSALRIKRKDVPFFIFFGLFKFLSDGTLFYAMGQVPISLATLLQMTAPYYVMILSLFMFRERITAQKFVAVITAFIGCIMVTGIQFENMGMQMGGVFSALMSGLFYALFLIGGKLGSDKGYAPHTVIFYMFLFGLMSSTVFSACTSDLVGSWSKMMDLDTLIACLVLGIALTLIPFYMFTYSSSKIEASLVSMVSVLELVVACLVGYFVFNEDLSITNILGMTLVISSIVIADVHIDRKRRAYKAKIEDEKHRVS